MQYHIPVMLSECIDGLQIRPDGVYVDLTFGGGGHSAAILSRLTTGKLFSFDQDEDAWKNASHAPFVNHPCFQLIQANFRYVSQYLRLQGVRSVDGILADLGVSSYQFDTATRGFSFRFEGPLDMRMDQQQSITAADVLNTYKEADLHKLMGMYGEITNAKTLAHQLVVARAKKPFKLIADLLQITDALAPKGSYHKYNAQVFQALRIEVNEELKALEEMLLQIPDVLKPNGRLVVMSYHSLEDRLVKNFIKEGRLYGAAEKDLYGKVSKPLESITRKPVEPAQEEIDRNPRARSAKIRIAEKSTLNS